MTYGTGRQVACIVCRSWRISISLLGDIIVGFVPIIITSDVFRGRRKARLFEEWANMCMSRSKNVHFCLSLMHIIDQIQQCPVLPASFSQLLVMTVDADRALLAPERLRELLGRADVERCELDADELDKINKLSYMRWATVHFKDSSTAPRGGGIFEVHGRSPSAHDIGEKKFRAISANRMYERPVIYPFVSFLSEFLHLRFARGGGSCSIWKKKRFFSPTFFVSRSRNQKKISNYLRVDLNKSPVSVAINLIRARISSGESFFVSDKNSQIKCAITVREKTRTSLFLPSY